MYHKKAKKIINELKKNKVQTKIIYPYPIHKMKAYSHLKFNKKNLNNSFEKSKGIFSLPLNPNLSESEVKKISNILKKIVIKLEKNLIK